MGVNKRLFGLQENYTLDDLREAYLKKLKSFIERAREKHWEGFVSHGRIFQKLNDAFLVLYKQAMEPTKRTETHDRAEEIFREGKKFLYEGKNRKAAELFQNATVLNQHKHYYYGFLGIALKNLKSYDAAVKALETAIELFPISQEYWLTLAETYLEAGQKSKAMECFAAAFLVDPTNTKPLEKMDAIDPTAFILKKRKKGLGLFDLFKKK